MCTKRSLPSSSPPPLLLSLTPCCDRHRSLREIRENKGRLKDPRGKEVIKRVFEDSQLRREVAALWDD